MSNYHLQVIRLTDGDNSNANQIENWWIRDGIWTQRPVEHAISLPARYAMSGMVDAHTHLSMDMGVFGLPDASSAVIETNIQSKLRQGVTAVRDAGALPDAVIDQSISADISIIPTGKLISPPGHGYPRLCTPVGEDHLIDFALNEVAHGMRWVKVIAEFPIGELNHFASVPTYSLNTLERLCKAVHAKGAKVAMHTATNYAANCVRVGADSIEHGPGLTPDDLMEMAKHNIAWVPTLTTVIGVCEFLVNADVPAMLKEKASNAMSNIRHLLPLAEKLGITVMVGTDEHPADFVGEVRKLVQYGLSTKAALRAASSGARAYLGLPVWVEGAPAEAVLFEDNPLTSLDVLARPSAVITGKRLMSSQ